MSEAVDVRHKAGHDADKGIRQWRSGTNTTTRQRASTASRGARRGRRASPSTCMPMSPCRARPNSSSRISTSSTDPAGAFRHGRDQGAQRQAGSRHPLAHRRQLRRALRRHGRDGRRHAAGHAARRRSSITPSPLEYAVQARADDQRWHRRISSASTRTASSRLGGVPMQDGNEAAKELERCMKQARLQGRRDSHQCRRQGTVRSGLRAVLEEGRGARRAGHHPSQRLHRRPSACRASTSTTSSAIRSRPRSRCIT